MVLKSCRCCCSTLRLEKAAKIIGIIFTILGAISFVWATVQLYNLDANYDLLRSQLSIILPEKMVEEILHRSRTTLVLRLVFSLLFTLFGALLVAGVQRKSKPMVLAFVVFYVLYLIFGTIGIFYSFYDPTIIIDQGSIAKLQKENANIAKAVVYGSLAISLVIISFFWYLAVVVYSYYKEMGSGPGRMQEHCQLN